MGTRGIQTARAGRVKRRDMLMAIRRTCCACFSKWPREEQVPLDGASWEPEGPPIMFGIVGRSLGGRAMFLKFVCPSSGPGGPHASLRKGEGDGGGGRLYNNIWPRMPLGTMKNDLRSRRGFPVALSDLLIECCGHSSWTNIWKINLPSSTLSANATTGDLCAPPSARNRVAQIVFVSS